MTEQLTDSCISVQNYLSAGITCVAVNGTVCLLALAKIQFMRDSPFNGGTDAQCIPQEHVCGQLLSGRHSVNKSEQARRLLPHCTAVCTWFCSLARICLLQVLLCIYAHKSTCLKFSWRAVVCLNFCNTLQAGDVFCLTFFQLSKAYEVWEVFRRLIFV